MMNDTTHKQNAKRVNFGSIATIATNVFREAIRDRIFYLVGAYAVFLVLALVMLPEIAGGTEEKMLVDFSLTATTLIGLAIAILLGTGLIKKEIERRTILVLAAKPISRTELAVGKFLGLAIVLFVLDLAATGFSLVLLAIAGVSYDIGAMTIAALFLFFQLMLIVAASLVFGVFTDFPIAVFLSFCIYFLGHFSRDLLRLGEETENTTIEWMTTAFYTILPDLARLDLKNDAVYGLVSLPDAGTLLLNAAYGFVYILFLLSLAVAIFAQKEF